MVRLTRLACEATMSCFLSCPLGRGAPDYVKPELLYYITDWWFLHPNYEFKPKELERSKYPRIEEFIY